MKSLNRPYLPRLDFVRAGAAWWVVIYHGVQLLPTGGTSVTLWSQSPNPVLAVASQGWLALSVFLMVSGYSLGLGLRGHAINWKGYLTARWLRVAPLYLFLLFLGLVASSAASISSVFAAFTLLPIPGAFSPAPWLGTAWSVRLEFALYFLLPALVYLLAQKSRRFAVIGGMLFLAIVIGLLFRSHADAADILYWNIPGRIVEFSLGFGLAYLGIGGKATKPRISFGIVAVVGLAAIAIVLNQLGGFPALGGLTRIIVLVVTAGLCMLLLLWCQGTAVRTPRAITWVGKSLGTWSYSTYLWHPTIIAFIASPVVFLLVQRGASTSVALVCGLLVLVGATAVISWLSFQFVERPFLALRPRYVREEPATPADQPAK